VEDLTPKTKPQSYYEHDYVGFLAVLKRNSKKLAIDPARREPEHRAEFEGSHSGSGPEHWAGRAEESVRADGPLGGQQDDD